MSNPVWRTLQAGKYNCRQKSGTVSGAENKIELLKISDYLCLLNNEETITDGL